MTDECDCCGAVVIWYNAEQFHPGIATSSDGRLRVTQGEQSVILPAPAADIWTDICARKAVTEHTRHTTWATESV